MKIFVQCLLCCISVFTAIAQDSDSLAIQLQEITIPGDRAAARYKLQSLSAVNKDKQYLVEHRSGSLMMTLDRLPGVSAFQVRQGFAKPVIRGLGFNRLVISENDIKQQGQQWGADHFHPPFRFACPYSIIVCFMFKDDIDRIDVLIAGVLSGNAYEEDVAELKEWILKF